MPSEITGILLAGGQGQRMGGHDKGLIAWRGEPLAAHVYRRLAPQVARVIISANRNHPFYTALGEVVVADRDDGYQGPLAGIAAAGEQATSEWLLSVPCDAPLLPLDLTDRLRAAMGAALLCTVSDGDRLHPTFLLMHRRLLPALRAFLDRGERRMHAWLREHGAASADCADIAHAFFNINQPGDLERG